MSDNLKQEQIDELLKYFSRIKAYEKWVNYRLTGITELVWGLLMIIAGILDYLFSIIFPLSPNPIPWILTTLFGVILMSYVSVKKNPLYEEPQNNKNDVGSKLVLLVLTLVFLVTFILGFSRLNYLIMPFVSVAMGLFFVYRISSLSEEKILPKVYGYAVILSLLLSAIINLLIYYLYGLKAVIFHGLIFGILFGSSFTIRSYVMKKKIENMIFQGIVEN